MREGEACVGLERGIKLSDPARRAHADRLAVGIGPSVPTLVKSRHGSQTRVQTSSASGRMRSRLVGAALALLTLACLAPDGARAGCIHPESDGPDHFLLLRASGALAEAGRSARLTDSHSVPRPAPGGCTGPYCSNRSDQPLNPSVVSSPRMSQWAVLDAPPPPIAPSSFPRRGDDGDARPILAVDAIFHPPR
jgi:hypothetical protein